MSRKVKERLRALGLLFRTSHEDRIRIDEEIERRTGVYCDDAIEKGLISDEQLKEITFLILNKKRRQQEKEIMVV